MSDQQPASDGEHQHLDWSSALAAVNHDVSLMEILVDAFNTEAPALLSAMRDGVTNNDAAQLSHNAHTLKGSMRLFGAERAYELSFQLEHMKEVVAPNAGSVLGELETEIAAVLAELKQRCGG